MCILFHSRLYFSNKTTILFLKKPYIVCTTLILMDSNIGVKAQSIIRKKQSFEIVVIFLHINARKYNQNLFIHCQTIVPF
jgi:hypothetical protein